MATAERNLRVFISSASGALAPYRKAAVDVCQRLGFTPVNMESFSPERPPPAEVCRREVEGSDVFVLLLAHRYGERPPGEEERSYTELEYDWALSRKLPLITFVVDPKLPWPPEDIDRGPDADALNCFITRVKAAHLVKVFAEPGDLKTELFFALKPHEPATAAKAGASGKRARPSPPAGHAVPPYVGSAPFTGRAEDLKKLDAWGRSDDPVMVVEAIGGTGKSALTWEWTRLRASDVVRGLAGQLWWSFYDGSASIAAFLRELLLYVSDLPADEIGRLKRQELSDHALSALRAKPYLVVLDGFERLLTAYHRFDPTRLRDDEVPEKRSLIEPHAEDVVRSLVGAGPSKVLISTRLMPDALEGRFNHRMPGVRHMLLPGLSDTDTVKLLAELGVSGDRRAIARFFKPLDNHPLLIGTVAGLVRDYRHDPGAFDSWVCDANAGGALALPDLKQRRAHILEAAFAGLAPEHRRLLGWISEYPGPIAWPTLVEINPFFDEPRPIGRDRVSSRHVHAESLLIPALSDLGDRGLLWWDRSSNSYDLHPIVRAYIEEQLDDDDRVAANERVRDHFQALPPENLESATSVEDVRRTIAIFTALVRAGRTEEACTIWSSRLWNVLALKVGACATVVELLDPPWIREEDEIRTHYGIALLQLGRYEEAIAHVASVLGDTTARRSFQAVRVALLNLDEALRMAGKHASSSRCLELLTALATATRERPEGNLWLARAQHATIVGRYAEARELLRDAEAMGPPVNAPWFVGDVQLERLELILLTGAGQLSEWRIVQAEAELDLWLHRRRIAGLRRAYFLCEERFEQALEAALAVERFERNAGVESTPAGSAFPLAKLGRVEEATVAIEESLARFDRLHRAARPDYELARALQVLGRLDEATFHARMAYTTAWGEGPPYAHHSSLRRAQELLDQLGEAQPDLPTVDRETIRIPHEAKVRNFIAGLATQYWRPG